MPGDGEKEAWEVAKAEGNAFYSSGKFEEAIAKYSEALDDAELDNSVRSTILCNRAQTYLKMKKYEEAVHDCTSCLTLTPDHVKALFRRGSALEALGKTADALKDYRDCVKIDSTVEVAKAAIQRLDPSSAPRRSRAKPKKLSREDEQAILETQKQFNDIQRQLGQAREKRERNMLSHRRLTVASQRLDALPRGQRAFEGVGKMFVLRPLDDLMKSHAEQAKQAEAVVAVCEKTIAHLQKQAESVKSSLDELVKSAMGV